MIRRVKEIRAGSQIRLAGALDAKVTTRSSPLRWRMMSRGPCALASLTGL